MLGELWGELLGEFLAARRAEADGICVLCVLAATIARRPPLRDRLRVFFTEQKFGGPNSAE